MKHLRKALADHVDEEDKLNNETLSSLGQRGGWQITTQFGKKEAVIVNESGRTKWMG